MLFPIVILLGLNGLLVGVLNAHDHFTIPALSPLVWNLVIIAALVGLTPLLEGDDQIYAYAIGVLAGTACQFAMAFPVLRRLQIPIRVNFNWRDPRIRRVLLLMLPVTIGLGLINFNLLINTFFGFRISEEAPRAIDLAFRIYMLPQGMFSVAVATVLFPALSRLVARQDWDGLRATQANGIRQIALLLIPSAAVTIALVGADHAARLPSAASSTPSRPAWSPRRCSGSRSRCRSPGSTCCSRARSSRSRSRGRRPRWRA